MIATLDTSCGAFSSDSTSNSYYVSSYQEQRTAPDTSMLRYVDRYLAYDDLEKLVHAALMRGRDLSFLYRPLRKRILLPNFRARRIIRQPCWSAKRWRSLT